MGTEKLQSYIDSVDELEKAYAKVREYGTIIADTNHYLNNFPYKMTMSNVSGGFVLTADREYCLDAKIWPTAQQLSDALQDYIKKREKMKTLYNSLSDAQEKCVKPPPDI